MPDGEFTQPTASLVPLPEDLCESLDCLSSVLAARLDARPDEARVGIREGDLLRHAELTHGRLDLAAAGAPFRHGNRGAVACGGGWR